MVRVVEDPTPPPQTEAGPAPEARALTVPVVQGRSIADRELVLPDAGTLSLER